MKIIYTILECHVGVWTAHAQRKSDGVVCVSGFQQSRRRSGRAISSVPHSNTEVFQSHTGALNAGVEGDDSRIKRRVDK